MIILLSYHAILLFLHILIYLLTLPLSLSSLSLSHSFCLAGLCIGYIYYSLYIEICDRNLTCKTNPENIIIIVIMAKYFRGINVFASAKRLYDEKTLISSEGKCQLGILYFYSYIGTTQALSEMSVFMTIKSVH